MRSNQKIGRNKIGRMTPRLHGHTKIVFADKFGRETIKFDKDNLVTDAIQKIFESNYFGSIDYSLLMPAIRKTLGGVLLFENSLGNDGSDIWIPKSFDNPITAHAGQTVPGSLADDITRGLPNSAASVGLNNGYKMVWNFPETQGNGDISAVGLCHADFGDYALKDSSFKPLEMISNDSIKSVSFGNNSNRENIITVYDKYNGCTYTFINENINFDRYGQGFYNSMNEFKVIKRKNTLLNNIAVDMSHYLGNDEAAETFTLNFNFTATGAITNCPLPGIYIDPTNNLLWILFSAGNASVSGNFKAEAAAYDISKFVDGATVNPEFTQSGNDVNGAVMGCNLPVQSYVTESGEGLIPDIVCDTSYKLTLASYDDTAKEFALESLTPVNLNVNLGERFPENLPMGNYYLVRGYDSPNFSKLFEFDINNDLNNAYDVTTPSEHISPYFMESDNPIIGAAAWTWSVSQGFTMQKSGTAINKLYLATKNDLPATITKTAANSMRVEYTLTYV